MIRSFRALDRILRGEATRLPLLQQGRFEIPVGGLLAVVILLGMTYGAFMALPSLMARWNPHQVTHIETVYLTDGAATTRPVTYTSTRAEGVEQLLASMVKVPMLFLLTLAVTFPSLYVFNALLGSRLTMGALLKLLVAAIAVMLALLSAFGLIVGFFAVSTTSYPFMKLLNVVIFAVAGFMGLSFLLQTLHRLTLVQGMAPPPLPPGEEGSMGKATGSGALDPMPNRPANVTLVFRIWVIVFGLVGAQMGWVLRPFIGDPDQPFSFFRPRESNFFEGLSRTLGHLFGG